jgi:hypothetical protein
MENSREQEGYATAVEPLELTTTPAKALTARRSETRRRIPDAWSPAKTTVDALVAEGIEAGTVAACIPEFVDHWRGTGEPKADWEATFRNGVRKRRDGGWLPRAAPVAVEYVQETILVGKRCLEVFVGDKLVRTEWPDGKPVQVPARAAP